MHLVKRPKEKEKQTENQKGVIDKSKKKNKKKGQIDYFRQLVNFCYFNPHFCETLSLINLDFLTDFQGGHDGHLPTECPLVQW